MHNNLCKFSLLTHDDAQDIMHLDRNKARRAQKLVLDPKPPVHQAPGLVTRAGRSRDGEVCPGRSERSWLELPDQWSWVIRLHPSPR